MHAHDRLETQFRLAPAQLAALKRLGLHTIEDLLRHFPARYDVGGGESTVRNLSPGASVTLMGTIHKLETRKSWTRKIPVGEATLKDASGSVKIMWFHQPYLAKKFSEGMFVKAVGTVAGKDGKVYLANPHVEPADPTTAIAPLFKSDDGDMAPQLFAVYPETRGITSLWFRHHIERVFAARVHETLGDPIPADVRERYHLPDLATALVWIHTPQDEKHAQVARKRFAFEEMLAVQAAKAQDRAENDAQAAFPVKDASRATDAFLDSLPFKPTGAQVRAVADILKDFGRPHPMARLLEGDVGSGKTAVAAATAYAIVTSRPPARESGTLQVAYMAPTEILAQQHFESFVQFYKHLPINIALMTGSGCKKFPSKVSKDKPTTISRAQLLKWVKSGEIAMVVGTHALIQKSVEFQHLAYAIVDEQHRFGTKQRRALAKKSAVAPHFLSMTATPIPRTLALTLYGDLDISILDEKPVGRAKLTTEVISPKERDRAYEAMRATVTSGRQGYVICPRIDEPDPTKMNALMAKSAKAEAARLAKDVFPEFEIGLLHGGMKPAEKDAVMQEFASGQVQILVATSVVEVGVNVPNATIMLIEGAERFGLAQLHQLRGRIQRSEHPPTCFLLAETTGQISLKRLRTLAKSDDGFALAEADLESRGAGDLYGRQQWGISDLGMEALKNVKLIRAARDEAEALVVADPTLATHAALAERAARARGELHSE
ncbi:ATP-dependent DNA helicase RecG [Candidatus Kaiserbacteria bacterium]|nr:ATP-dependent DNA helicase RecG [Candidatus Kaiserbacteria bacterium]